MQMPIHAPWLRCGVCQEHKTSLLQVVYHLKVAPRSSILMSC